MQHDFDRSSPLIYITPERYLNVEFLRAIAANTVAPFHLTSRWSGSAIGASGSYG